MNIGDPKELVRTRDFARAYEKRCQNNNINHVRFLGDGDIFNFTCQRTNTCCRNFTERERIILDPYDVYRLSRNRRASTGRFLELYSDLRLDHETHIPIASLKYKGEESCNKCSFLRSYGCAVYEDRPLRCRLSPLGMISDRGISYFNLIDNCPRENDENSRSWTVRGWIEDSKAGRYIEFQNLLNDLYQNMNRSKYSALSEQVKLQFGYTIFDIDSFISSMLPESDRLNEGRVMRDIGRWARGFLIAHSCLDRDYDRADSHLVEEEKTGYPPWGKSNSVSGEHLLRDISTAKALIP